MTILKDANVLVTGGTGSFGRAFVRYLLELPEGPRRIVVFSRDELKQSEMAKELQVVDTEGRLRFFLGCVRDRERLRQAFRGAHVVVHAAALKQVPAAEYNPTEAVATNVRGTTNVTEVAIDQGVARVLMLSTDKAVNPVNLYGSTKLTAEKIVIAANAMAGPGGTRFSAVRYGNVMGSRGSVVPIFREQAATGANITITSAEMTRFWVTIQEAVAFVASALDRMIGGEIFIPKLPTAQVVDVAAAIAPNAMVQLVGVRPGEKIHERLISKEEVGRTFDYGDGYVILPDFDWKASDRQLSLGVAAHRARMPNAVPVPPDFVYRSDVAGPHLDIEQIRNLLQLVA